MRTKTKYSRIQKFWLVLFRMAIGWHFLYEGLTKLTNPNWSSVGYLLDSEGFMRNFYYNLAGNPGILRVVDFLNIWGLIAIGIGLITGTFARLATIAGVILLCFYFFSHPPFIGLRYEVPMEGSYLIINKILIELLAMVVLFLFQTSREFGVDRFIFGRRR